MAECGVIDPICWAGQQAAKTVSPLIWKQLEDWMARGAASAVRLAVAGWVNVDSPDVTTANGGVAYLTAYTRTITYVVFAIALMAQAGQLAWTQRGEDLRELVRGIVQFVVVSGGGVAVVALLTEAGNQYASWILTASTDGATGATMGDRILTLLGITGPGDGVATLSVSGPIVALLCFLVSIAGIVQVLLVYARAIVLVLLSGGFPLAAAAAMTRRGRPILERYLAWMGAWLLFKPVAASIYAGAFFMMGTGGALSFIAGMGAIVMAVFALPALMRLINPLTSGIGGGGSLGGAGALAGPIADGAVRMAGTLGSASAGDTTPTGGSAAVRDATYGSAPSGSLPPGSGGASPAGGGQGGPSGAGSAAGAGDGAGAMVPAGSAAGAGGGLAAGAGAAGGGSAAGAGAASGAAGGAAAGGAAAAAGPWAAAAVQGAAAARRIAGAPAAGARQVTDDATGPEGAAS